MNLLDTNALIKYLQDSDGEISDTGCFISRITYIEYLSYKDMYDEEVEEYSRILEEAFSMIELDRGLSNSAAALRRKFSISLGDAIILATAIDNDLELVTSDKRLRRKYDKLIAMKHL
ncbi:PIN domain-containing protein [Candidatus Dojkabacteria bacterium]|nr:PIN domain-containing protein [Candidatus Dojkabacteria bacterium]